MDKITLYKNIVKEVDFGTSKIIQNDTHTIYEKILVTETGTGNAHTTITGGNRARLEGILNIQQNYTNKLVVPVWEVDYDYKPDGYVDGTPPPVEILLTPYTIQSHYFEDVTYGVHHTNRQYDNFYISRTGTPGSWFRIEGKDTIIIKGNVFFKIDNDDKPITIALSNKVITPDRFSTTMDFTLGYGSTMKGAESSGGGLIEVDGEPITMTEFKAAIAADTKDVVVAELSEDLSDDLKAELKEELKAELKAELKDEIAAEMATLPGYAKFTLTEKAVLRDGEKFSVEVTLSEDGSMTPTFAIIGDFSGDVTPAGTTVVTDDRLKIKAEAGLAYLSNVSLHINGVMLTHELVEVTKADGEVKIIFTNEYTNVQMVQELHRGDTITVEYVVPWEAS